jgi:hypothetical protein
MCLQPLQSELGGQPEGGCNALQEGLLDKWLISYVSNDSKIISKTGAYLKSRQIFEKVIKA